MKAKLTTPLLAAIGAIVLVVMLFLSFYLSTSAYRVSDTGIVLPSESTVLPVIPSGGTAVQEQTLQTVSVTPENVQQVIASLKRPAAYSCTVQNTLQYGEHSQTLTRQQYCKRSACRTDELGDDGTVQRSILHYGRKTYAWERGDATYYTGASGTFSDDGAAMLPTYETVLALPKESITEAGLTNLNYEPCIYVRTTEGTFTGAYYISSVSGLLVRADISQDGAPVRSCVLSAASTAEPADAYFILPSGISVFDVKG